MSIKLHFILGGARSGKSTLAENTAKNLSESGDVPVIYVATAQGKDQEMQQRIARHQGERPQHWTTIEEPLELAALLERYKQKKVIVLVDCLTLWLCNWLTQFEAAQWQGQKQAFLAVLTDIATQSNIAMQLILVSNEVGQGIVPLGELNRQFADESGWLHQAISQQADKVDFVMAGLALALKPGGQVV